MPWRLIVFLLSLLVLLVFAAFNMNNASDISFGFYELENVPVFVSLLFSFILGVLFALPFAYFGKRTKVKKQKKGIPAENPVDKSEKKERKFPFSKKDKKKDDGNTFEKPDDLI